MDLFFVKIVKQLANDEQFCGISLLNLNPKGSANSVEKGLDAMLVYKGNMMSADAVQTALDDS